MQEVSTIGLNIAKSVFQLHGVDDAGNVVFRKRLARSKVLAFFAERAPSLKALHLRVTQLPGIAAYLASELRYPKPGADYVIAAAQVLQRALPNHMPDADRFITKDVQT